MCAGPLQGPVITTPRVQCTLCTMAFTALHLKHPLKHLNYTATKCIKVHGDLLESGSSHINVSTDRQSKAKAPTIRGPVLLPRRYDFFFSEVPTKYRIPNDRPQSRHCNNETNWPINGTRKCVGIVCGRSLRGHSTHPVDDIHAEDIALHNVFCALIELNKRPTCQSRCD